MKGSDWYELFVPIVLLGLFVLALFGVYRFKGDLIKAPLLTINSSSDVVTSEDSLILTGTTEKNVNKLLINNNLVEPDASGNFEASVPLIDGQNQIKVVAYNYELNKSTKELTVTKEPKTEAVLGVDNTQPSVASENSTTTMASSGPRENVAILGLSALITLFVINFDQRKTKNKHNLALQQVKKLV